MQLTPYFQNGILGDFLCAYRKHHSCHTTLLHLVEDWKQSWDRVELVTMVAMDLSKAFDSLPHSLLVRKLQAYDVDEQSCSLLQGYLQGRLQRVKVRNAVSSWDFNRRGVPQGSVLGPLLFNVFFNDLSYFITRVNFNAYADDQQLYSSDSDHVALYNKLNDKLCIAVEWFKHDGLMTNPEKFQSMTLGNTDQDILFVVNGTHIKKSDDIDLLGVNIDSKLTFLACFGCL